MLSFDTIIIGGGASGCMCALATNNKNIAIIDKDNKIAKKLLVTGNGRCNLTNTNMNSTYFNRDISSFLDKFDYHRTIEFFSDLGLVTFNDEQGRLYPISNSAKSVVSVIENALTKKSIRTFLDNTVIKIEKNDHKFIVHTDKNQFICNNLVIATGKNDLLDNLKIEYKNFTPSLCALKTNSTKLLTNIRLRDVKVTGCINGKYMSDVGEVLFKDSGLSGIAIFDISSLFAREGKFDGKVIIDMLPKEDNESLIKMLHKRKALNCQTRQFFDGMFVKEVAYEIFNRCKIDENKLSTLLTDQEIENFAYIIKNLDYTVKGYYPNNQVFSGGVRLSDLDENLQHKRIKNLYFCGEVCDVDGQCGGYNLQWAWTSGYIVGSNV